MTPHLLLSALAALASLQTQDAEPQDLATVAAEQGPFSIVLELSGTFDEPGAVEVAYKPEVYSGELVVTKVEHAGPVIAGQWLVKLDTEKIDQAIERARMDLEIARAKVERQAEEAKHQKEASAIQLANAEMAYRKAEQTLTTFKDVLMPMKLAEAELGIQSSKDRLKESEEQFEQLKKMYGSDDLVEETEEIVLGREKRSLEQSRKRLTFSLRRHELLTTIDVPRELQGYELAFRKATNTWELAKVTSGMDLEKSASDLEKASWELARQEESFEALQRDREGLTIKAPVEGVAVAGQLARGKWTRLDENSRSLRSGEKLSANKVLYTIVQPGPKIVRTTVPESSILDVAAGQGATVAPAASPNAEVDAKVIHVARVSTNGQFDAWLEVAAADGRLIAGNSCSIRLPTVELEDAITVPASAVSEENGESVVQVWADSAYHTRKVRAGRTSQGRTVIVSGLEAGERVKRNAREAGSK